jgi:hypothetical protein
MKVLGVTGLYVTLAALCAAALLLVVLLARSTAGLQPVRGLAPFSLDEAPASVLPDGGAATGR